MDLLTEIRTRSDEVRSLLIDRAENDEDIKVSTHAVRRLGGLAVRDPQVLRDLRALIDDSPAQVRAAALRSLSRSEPISVASLKIFLRHAVEDPAAVVREAAIVQLCRHWPDHPRTLPLLQRSAVESATTTHRSPRSESPLDLLVRRWADHPETLSIVRKCVTMKPDAEQQGLRGVALTLLATYWPDDPATHALLRARVTEDPNDDVRLTALQLWAAAPRTDDSGTCAIVRDRAAQDSSRHVRCGALLMLAFAWPEDEQAHSQLLSSAAEDPEPVVQAVAEQAVVVAERLNSSVAEAS